MNRILTSLTVCLAASSLIVASAAKTSQAAIVTFRDGQDLVIEFERSIEFIATERYEDTVYGIVLKDVYSQNNITTIVSDQKCWRGCNFVRHATRNSTIDRLWRLGAFRCSIWSVR